MNAVCAYLKFDAELSTCAAENKQRFQIKEVNLTLYFGLKNNTALDDIFVHIALIYLTLHCLSLSFCQLQSNIPPAAQLLLSQS
jgi:hypothetical protein